MIGSHLARLRQEFKKVWNSGRSHGCRSGDDEIPLSTRPRVAERVATHVSPEDEPQNLDLTRTVESVFWSPLSGRLSEVYLEFCNQRYRDEFPRTSIADLLRDACGVCSRGVSDELSRISLCVCCDGRWIFRSGIGRILTSTLLIWGKCDAP